MKHAMDQLQRENGTLKQKLAKAKQPSVGSPVSEATLKAAATACHNSTLSVQLAQKNKLLTLHNAITGIQIALIECDDENADDYVDVAL